MIPYSRQSINKDDLSAVLAVLKSDIITQGDVVEEFEKEIAKYLGVKYAITFNSATSALYTAYKILDYEGFEFITTPLTFCATSNMMLNLGIKPIFCEIDNLGNIDTFKIEKLINKNTRAIVSVDYAGISVDVYKIIEICKRYNLSFISDSSHSFGGEYKGRKIGQFADMSIFSFHALKPITTIEGGAIVTNNKDFYKKALLIRSHGIIKNELWDSQLDFTGFNFRLSDVASALGISQLKRLEGFIEKRAKIANFYNLAFKDNPFFSTLEIPKHIKSSHHLYPILLNQKLWKHKKAIFKDLLDKGIGIQVHYKPLYQYNLYKNHAKLQSAECFYNAEISIPCHQKMSLKDAKFVAKNLLKILKKYR